MGAIYLADEDNGERSLQLAGSYAYTDRKGNRNIFRLGEGLVGQAALEQESLLFNDVPEDYIKVSSGLGETVPRQILVAPFMYEGDVKGAIELATLKEFTAIHQDFLRQACENIAIAVNSAQTRMKMHELLEATQQQAKELQDNRNSYSRVMRPWKTQARTLKNLRRDCRCSRKNCDRQTKSLKRRPKTLKSDSGHYRKKSGPGKSPTTLEREDRRFRADE